MDNGHQDCADNLTTATAAADDDDADADDDMIMCW